MPTYTDQEILDHRNSFCTFWCTVTFIFLAVFLVHYGPEIERLRKAHLGPTPSGISTGASIEI